MPTPNRVLVKLRPQTALGATASRANLRPLYDTGATVSSFGLEAAPAWYLAELPDGGPTPWDAAHAQIADQLGVSDSDRDLRGTRPCPEATPTSTSATREISRSPSAPTAIPPRSNRRRKGARPQLRLASTGRLLPTGLGARCGCLHRSAHAHRAHRHGLRQDAQRAAGKYPHRSRTQFRGWRRQPEQLAGSESPRHVRQLRPRHRAPSAFWPAGRWRCSATITWAARRTPRSCPSASPTRW